MFYFPSVEWPRIKRRKVWSLEFCPWRRGGDAGVAVRAAPLQHSLGKNLLEQFGVTKIYTSNGNETDYIMYPSETQSRCSFDIL